MAKSENQKQKILVLLDLFKSKTDEEKVGMDHALNKGRKKNCLC